MQDIEAIIGEIIEREAGYVDHPNDRGGPTKYGVTQRTLAEYRGHPVTAEDVRHLTEAEARHIYRANYLTRHQLYRIQDPYLLSLVFDCAINHGPQRAVRWLQKAAGVVDDGEFGDQTEVAVNSQDSVRLYQRVLARRIVYYGEILNSDHSQVEFALGWLRRAASFVEV